MAKGMVDGGSDGENPTTETCRQQPEKGCKGENRRKRADGERRTESVEEGPSLSATDDHDYTDESLEGGG